MTRNARCCGRYSTCTLAGLPTRSADAQAAKYAGDRLHDVHFLWAGGTEPGDPMYYRLQGASLMVEYENAVRDANHVHTVWRDLDNDWGRDVLAEHHATHQHRDRHDH